MSFLELAQKRQSVRKYLGKSVPRDVIERCLQAAQAAPSACNSQPWTFIVIDNEALKNKLADECFSGLYAINAFVKKAPVIVVAVTERSTYIARLAGYLRGAQYSLIDIGIAVEHFVLQAEEEGLGTCWLGWFDEKKIKKILDIPEDKKIDVCLSVGYPEPQEVRVKKRKTLDEMRRYI